MFRGAPRGQRVLLNLRTKGAHHGRSKPWAEMRELISTGRVKPVGRGEWMLPGPLQSSAPSSPMLPPMLPPRAPDRLPDDFESMMARVRSSTNAAWDEYYRNIPRQSSQEGSMSTVPPRTPSPRSTPQPQPPASKAQSPVAGDRERTETEAVFARMDANFREYLAGFSKQILGELSQVRRSVEDLGDRVTQVSRSVGSLDDRVTQVSRSVGSLDDRVTRVSHSVGGLEARMSRLEASRRPASSDLSSDGARGGKIVADPPSPGPDPDRAGSESRRAQTIHPAPHVADPCLESMVEAIPPPHIHHIDGLRLTREPPEGLCEEHGPPTHTHRPWSALEPWSRLHVDCMSRLPEPPLVRRTPVRADFGQATVPPPFRESAGRSWSRSSKRTPERPPRRRSGWDDASSDMGRGLCRHLHWSLR